MKNILIVAAFALLIAPLSASAATTQWKYITCVINGKPMKFIGGLKSQKHTNKCPISVSTTQPD